MPHAVLRALRAAGLKPLRGLFSIFERKYFKDFRQRARLLALSAPFAPRPRLPPPGSRGRPRSASECWRLLHAAKKS